MTHRLEPDPTANGELDDRPRVLVVMPRYGYPEPEAMRALYCPTHGAVNVFKISESATSCAPATFNTLLGLALDFRDAGWITHLGMIHQDIDPKGPWLDMLWEEMQEHDADFISAVSPIKEKEFDVPMDDPPTSTAIGFRDDPWKTHRRIHVSEYETLPLTFGRDDVCRPDQVFLVNTGLALMDLRHPAWDAFKGFEFITDLIQDDPNSNGERSRVARMQSDDWIMSRHLDQFGARVFATWRVPLLHYGRAGWSNLPRIKQGVTNGLAGRALLAAK